MNSNDLKKFADQLARWARTMIECGRTPFRAVETAPRLWTRQGNLHPPLVFWINRQSLQAAGLVFFSDEPATGLAEGQACAEALGLRHFATWTADRVTIWEQSTAPPVPTRHFPLPQAGVEGFHQQLHNLMNEFKLLAVTGAVPPLELPAEYLCNLCRISLGSGRKDLVEAARRLLSEEDEVAHWIDAERLAWHTGATALLRLLLLSWHDTLPDQLHPERLERAFALSRSQLPGPLRRLLDNPLPLPQLPHSVCVDLLGLLHRLAQVGWRQNPDRAGRTLEQLWPWIAEHLDLTQRAPQEPAPVLWKDPALPLEVTPVAETSSWPTPLLARALWRAIGQKPQPALIPAPPLATPSPEESGRLVLRVEEGGRPLTSRQDQAPFLDQLRRCWPQRRVDLPNGSPVGMLQLLYWQGLRQPDQSLEMSFPTPWLQRPGIREVARLWPHSGYPSQLDFSADGICCLTVEDGATDRVMLISPETEVAVDWADLPDTAPMALLLLSLAPSSLQEALIQGRLRWTQDDDTLTPGLALYLGTAMAADCWRIVTGRPLPRVEDIRQLPAGLPVPGDHLLRQLDREAAQPEATRKDIEGMLCDWLEWPGLPSFSQPDWLQNARGETARTSGPALESLMRQVVDTNGLPRFPDTYLYRHPDLPMKRFRLQPPLAATEAFFGQVELTDAQGQTLVVDEPTAQALQLASNQNEEEIQLPRDPEQVHRIIAEYRQDLEQLWRQLEQLAAAHCTGPRQTERRVSALWQGYALPALDALRPE